LKKSRITSISTLTTIVVLLASGCSAGSKAASGNGTITITFWNHINPSTQPVDKKLIAQYESAHPNIKINYLTASDENMAAKLNMAIAGGEQNLK